MLLYFKSDGLLYRKTSTSAGAVESLVAGGVPSGGSTAQFLRGDNQWVIPDLTYLTSSWVKQNVRVATTAAGQLVAATTAIDGVTLAIGDRILDKDDGATNGIFVVTALAPAFAVQRATDAGTAAQMAGAAVAVNAGAINGGSRWATGFRSTDSLGVTPSVWVRWYSDLNPPETLARTVFQSVNVGATPVGQTQEFTQDGKGLWSKTNDNVIHKIGHQTVRAATTASITLTAAQTVDGIALNGGDYVLVKDQATPSQNGVYIVAASTAWTRLAGFDSAQAVGESGLVTVQSGALWGGTMWETDFKVTDTLGTTGMAWAMVNNPAIVKAATTANTSLIGPLTIDGVSCNAGDRVLVRSQTSAPANGIYIVGAAGVAWTRAPDSDTIGKLLNQKVVVQSGATYGGMTFNLVMQLTDALGTANVNYNATRVEGVSPLTFPTPAGTGHTVFDNTTRMLATWDAGSVAWRYSGAAQVSPTATPPASPVVGQQWFDSTLTMSKVWDGTTWQTAGRDFAATAPPAVGATSVLGTAVTVAHSDHTHAPRNNSITRTGAGNPTIATSTFTLLPLDTTITGGAGDITTIASPGQFQVTTAGTYMLIASVSWASTVTQTNRRLLQIETFTTEAIGTGAIIIRDDRVQGANSGPTSNLCVAEMFLPALTKIRAVLWQNSGAGVALDNATALNRFTIRQMS